MVGYLVLNTMDICVTDRCIGEVDNLTGTEVITGLIGDPAAVSEYHQRCGIINDMQKHRRKSRGAGW